MSALPLALGATSCAAAIAGLGLFHPRVALFGPVLWAGSKGRNEVALTFDDGPHPAFTPRIAQLLASGGARGTFFCVGKEVERFPELTAALVKGGHAVENHTFAHDTFGHLFSARRLTEDLERCQQVIARSCGQRPRFYRPAVGIRNPAVHAAARNVGLTVVTWANAARDGALRFTSANAARMAQLADDADVLTLHDGTLSGRSALRESTLEHLPALIAGLRARGFALVTVPQLLR